MNQESRNPRSRKWEILFPVFLISLFNFSSCSHLTVAPKPVVANAIAFDENSQNAGIIDCDKAGCMVTPNWVSKYKQLEATFKHTVAADANIKSEGDHWRVSYEVVENFIDMKAAERGP